jgi:hypothetical protein
MPYFVLKRRGGEPVLLFYSPLFNKHLLVLHVLGFRFFFFFEMARTEERKN